MTLPLQQIRTLDDALDRIADLEYALGVTALPPIVGLTPTEHKLLGMLLFRPIVRKAAAYVALFGLRAEDEQPQDKMLDIYICHLRRKLKPRGLEIQTLWAVGWFMSPDMQQLGRRLFQWPKGWAA